MSSLRDKVSKNFSQSKKTEFERGVNELSGAMSEMAAIQLVLGEMFREGKEDGGIMGSISALIKKNRENPTPESLRELQKIIPDAVEEFKLPGMEGQELFKLNEKAIEKFLEGRTKAAEGGISKLLGE